MARREYKGAATPTTLVSGITNSATSLTLTDSTNWPTGSHSLVIDPGLAGEEKILATSRTGTVVTLTTRGYDNTTAASHLAGAIIYPVPTAVDFDESNNLVSGITAGTGIAMAGSTSGSTLFKSSAVAGTTTVTLPAATDTLVGKDTTDILTNKTLTAPVINLGTNAQTGTTYTFVLGDAGKLVTASNASAQTYSIPTNASVAYAVGTEINIIAIGAGQVTIQATTSGTTTVLSNGGTAAAPKLRVQYSSASCIKVATDTWYVIGDIS